MRISHVYAQRIAPFSAAEGEIYHAGTADARVLLMGIGGSSKSMLLRVIAALGDENPDAPFPFPDGNAALYIDDGAPMLLCHAADETFVHTLSLRHPEAEIVGRVAGERRGERRLPANILLLNNHIGQSIPDVPQPILETVNRLLVGKQLLMENGELRVRLPSGGTHAWTELSGGERRILQLCLGTGTRLKPGGVLLLDEPDAHLHPSQVLGVLTALEMLVTRLDAQLLLTSHNPMVWRRYETLGLHLRMEGKI